MIVDSHVHLGWYSDGYHSPNEVWNALRKADISKACVSSTSTCAELYHNIQTEFYQLFSLAGKENICPILWLSPSMLLKGWPLKDLIKSKIEWQGIKLHYISHPLWAKTPSLVDEALDIARSLGGVPVLLHTGEWENCHAGVFESIVAANSDLNFVLAHGRPIEETIHLMKNLSNVWTDTAFMPVEDIKRLEKEGLAERVMFGSDAPINKIYFPNISIGDYLKRTISKIKRSVPSVLSNSLYFK